MLKKNSLFYTTIIAILIFILIFLELLIIFGRTAPLLVKTPENVLKNISNTNKQLLEMGYSIELNLYDCVSDDFLKDALKRNNVFLPVNIISAPIDKIISHRETNYDKLSRNIYNAFLLAGKVVDIKKKRYHYVISHLLTYNDEKDYITFFEDQSVHYMKTVFLQLEIDGDTVNVMLYENYRHLDMNRRQLRPPLPSESAYKQKPEKWNSLPENKLKSPRYLEERTEIDNRRYLYDNNRPIANGDTVYLVVKYLFQKYIYPEFSPDTSYNEYSIPSLRHLEKQDSTGIFDMSFLQQDKLFMLSRSVKPNKIFNSKKALLDEVRKNAQDILVARYINRYWGETWKD